MPSNKTFNIIQLGNDQLTPKATFYPMELKKYGLNTFYFSEDRSGLSSQTIKNHEIYAKIASKNIFIRWFSLLLLFVKYRPSYVELYLSQRPWHLLYYYFLSKFFNAKILVWCRGELRNYFTHHKLRRMVNKFLLLKADKILLRENYMVDVLKKANIYMEEKTIFFPNSIPVSQKIREYDENSNRILFLNSFKSFRNIELIIDAAEIINKNYPSLIFELVGSTLDNKGYSPSCTKYENMLRKRVIDKNLTDIVKFYPFCSDRFKYFHKACVFVLPADIVFCNYTLLEAMSFEIPAIVADVKGADLIVEDNKTGFVVKKDPKEIAKSIEILITDKEKNKTFGKNSRKKIEKEFNVFNRAKQLNEIYRSL